MPLALASLDALPAAWTPIASRPRQSNTYELPPWKAVPGAPLTIAEAHALLDAGRIVMANRHTAACVTLVVRPAVRPPDKPILLAAAFRRL